MSVARSHNRSQLPRVRDQVEPPDTSTSDTTYPISFDTTATSSQPQSTSQSKKRRRVTVEEDIEFDINSDDVPYNGPPVIDQHPTAGECFGTVDAAWEKRQKDDQCPWAPFSSQDEWQLSRWLMRSGTSQEMIDEFLKLNIIRTKLEPSFKNKYEFLQRIDQLPTGPHFKSKTFSITGDLRNAKGQLMTEMVEMYYRDPVEVVEDLISRPSLWDHLTYSPMKIYTSPARQTHIYKDMSSGDWWYDIQDKLVKGATVVPVIIASDKTALTNFSGDKVAYPVYLTIGNASKSIRSQPSLFVTVVIGYLPVPSLACCSDNIRSLKTYQLFHTCMKKIMEPLERCGREGKKMACADRNIRNIFPIVAAHMADAPEQCLIACCQENHCPRCLVPPDQRGSLSSFDS
ncbi:hypothetical protein FRC03_002563 [Tulasnella sp. 419]|nr:hypothetical protein FRC03_002563 [Tulasnella sp. 419]